MHQTDTSPRLAALRQAMKEHKIDVYIVPSEDAHSSEYTAICDGRRQYISGFTGSAGCAVITHDKAALATDGRYFNQATNQLDNNWTLLKQGLQDVPTWEEWATEESAGGKVVGVDPTLLSSSVAEKLANSIKEKGGSDLVGVSKNLVDIVWGTDRPARTSNPVFHLEDRFTGKDVKAKLADLRKELSRKRVAAFVVTMLDEVAWLFNLRGSDISYNPIFFSYALVNQDAATLYIDSARLTEDARKHLSENGIALKAYDAIFEDARSLGSKAQRAAQAPKYLISSKTSWAVKLALGGEKFVDEVRSPIGDAKAIKTETELDGFRQCNIRDGAALSEYFAWLEDQLVNKKVMVDEVDAADKLEACRAKQKHYVGLSFPTVSATGPNAAVMHYQPEKGACSVIDPNAIYLCDSGAQYRDGTTDTTRTLHFGAPTEMERRAFTLVLKGNIALDTAIFPKGTSGFALDAFARQFLWQEGLDYRHGTGHGVGSFLNVHEGPIGVGFRKAYADVGFVPGHVVSNEPGYYEDGNFGIRLENVIVCKEASTKFSFGDKPYLGFENVTMTPFCKNLIDVSLLTARERKWINDYHAEVLEKTKSYFQHDDLTMKWLQRECQPL